MIKLLVPKHPPIEAAMPYLQRIDAARWYSNFGQNVQELEQRLSEKFEGAYVVTVSSCTAGLELAYLGCLMRGFRTLELPAYTFPATWFAAMRAGMNIKTVDVDKDAWVSHYVSGFGTPTYGPVVDAAGAIYEQRVPILPRMTAVFSLHATKPISAGEGGFVVTWDEGEAQAIRQMSNFGLAPDGSGSRMFGTNAKMSEYSAAIALAGMDAWDREPWLRLWDWYDRLLPGSVVRQARPRGAYPMLVVKVPGSAIDAVRDMHVRGIECRRWYTPTMDKHPMFQPKQPTAGRMNGHKRARDAARPHLPVTWDLVEHAIGLPYHLHLTEQDVERVCAALADVVDQAGRGQQESRGY